MRKIQNPQYTAAKFISRSYMVAALALSYTHIVDLFHGLGATGVQVYLAPLFIDGFALLGQLCRSERFSRQTRRVGMALALVAGVGSLLANVIAGHTLGDQVIGAMVVIGFVVAEAVTGLMAPAEVDKAADLAAARSAAAAKAAATRKANAAAKAKTTRARTAAAKARAAASPARKATAAAN